MDEKKANIVELDPHEPGAEEVFMDEKKAKLPEPGKPFSPALFMPPMETVRLSADLLVKQALHTVDGQTVSPGKELHIEDVRETLVDLFESGKKYRLGFNLFSPRSIEEGKQYPLVIFIPDAAANGDDPRIALLQGGGATLFAADEIQEENPCFILAFEIPHSIPFTSDDFSVAPEFDDLKRIIDDVMGSCPIDKSRVYITGQSQGCMSACELCVRYPDLITAALLVAGQWDPVATGKACAGKKLWIAVSDGDLKAYPGMTALTEELQKNGSSVSRLEVDAKAPLSEQNSAVLAAQADGADVHFMVFTNHSVLPEGVPDNGGTNHMFTWPAAYSLDSLRRWLLLQ